MAYRQPQRKKETIRKAKPRETLLRGYKGKVQNLWTFIDTRIQELNISWVELATRMRCSRQYLDDMTGRKSIQETTFYLLCQALEVDPEKYIERVEDETV